MHSRGRSPGPRCSPSNAPRSTPDAISLANEKRNGKLIVRKIDAVFVRVGQPTGWAFAIYAESGGGPIRSHCELHHHYVSVKAAFPYHEDSKKNGEEYAEDRRECEEEVECDKQLHNHRRGNLPRWHHDRARLKFFWTQ